jgi:hypothetical protein
MTRRLTALTLLCLTILLGLAWRTLPLHLSPFFFKYGGSALWAIALYWLLASLFPKLTPAPLAILSAITTALLELSRLYHLPALDAFRLTLAGRLLLGRFFSPKNIAAYWLAIAAAALLDHLFPRPSPPGPQAALAFQIGTLFAPVSSRSQATPRQPVICELPVDSLVSTSIQVPQILVVSNRDSIIWHQ